MIHFILCYNFLQYYLISVSFHSQPAKLLQRLKIYFKDKLSIVSTHQRIRGRGCSPQLIVIYDVVFYCGTVFIWLCNQQFLGSPEDSFSFNYIASFSNLSILCWKVLIYDSFSKVLLEKRYKNSKLINFFYILQII